ncbi:MAG: arginine repressor [Bdellovibrionales bacterium]|nr:arginine repressor [Bdellovibrionales bacterium]
MSSTSNTVSKKNFDARARATALRRLLEEGDATTQEEICQRLDSMGFEVTQSTISRSLRKIGAVKAVDETGQTVYRLMETPVLPTIVETTFSDLVTDISHNGAMIIIKTAAGSASLLARHLDTHRPGDLMGTIAGDDTIFVAPKSLSKITDTVRQIRTSLNFPDSHPRN